MVKAYGDELLEDLPNQRQGWLDFLLLVLSLGKRRDNRDIVALPADLMDP